MVSLERFAASLPASDASMLAAIQDYIEWQTHHQAAGFVPREDDDVDLRTYLSHLRINGIDPHALEERMVALNRFYQWLQAKKLIAQNPFDDYDFQLSSRTSKRVQPREQTLRSDRHTGEVERLRALAEIAEQLNSSVDIQSALDSTLKTLLRVMGLQTGWVSMLTKSHIMGTPVEDALPHGFRLAAACGLPPGLEREDRRFLRQPPACRCQHLLIEGRLTSAVNIVECSRLQESASAAGDNQGLSYHASVPLISKGGPLGTLNVASAEWQFLTEPDLDFLAAVSGQLVVAMERAHFFEIAEARRLHLEKELEVAHNVQAGLIPRIMPDVPGFGLAGAWRPAREVAGDFYDIFPLDDDRWGIVIGDVADKGTAAVLYMAMARSLILSALLRHRNPAAALTEVNRMILLQYSSDIFVTVVLAVFDPKGQTLQYANAGHEPPIVRRASGTIESLKPTGPAVALFDELKLEEQTIRLGSGDAIVMYTDGVTEARNPRMQFYDKDRLIAAIAAAPQNAGELLAHVEADLNAFTEGAPQSDDVALLVLTKD